MKKILNLLLLAALAWAVFDAARPAHAEGSPEKGSLLEATYDGETQLPCGISDYSIERALVERPSHLVGRLLGSLSGMEEGGDIVSRLELSHAYEKTLSLRTEVVSRERISPIGDCSRILERRDRSLSRDKRILESSFPFVRSFSENRKAEDEVLKYARPLLDETFYELTVDDVMAVVEGIDVNLLAGKFSNVREAVAMFLVREIYLERVESAQKFICEIPSCKDAIVSLGSAPPAVEYFFEQQFGAFEARGCGDGTLDTPEMPCRKLPEPLATAVSDAVASFEYNAGAYDDAKFYFMFMDYANVTTLENVTGANISVLDPIGSGARLAEAFRVLGQ